MIEDLFRSKCLLEECQTDPSRTMPFQKEFNCPYDLSKELKDQINNLAETPYLWVDDQETMDKAIKQLYSELEKCPLLAVDLEYAHADPTIKLGEQPRTTIVGLI